MFVTRLISGVILVIVAILLLFFGELWLLGALGILSLIGCYELLRVFQLEKKSLGMVTYIATIAYYVLVFLCGQVWASVFVFPPVVLALLVIYVQRYPKYKIDSVTKALFTFFYVSVLLSFVYMTRSMVDGQWLVWLIIIASWGSDTCAYCVGKLIGKHHFSQLSPKKTIEGCIGGVVGATIIAFVYAIFFERNDVQMYVSNPKIIFSIVAAVCAVISQIGDLAASAIKRNYEVKDYGNLIPGHGGVLDRFDSVIFVAPVVYYLIFITAILI